MRNLLLASAALLGLAVAVPAFAQTTNDMPASDAAPMATDSGAMDKSMPMKPRAMHKMHMKASNNTTMDTRSVIAPNLPVPPVGANGSPEQYLIQAQRALQQHRTGEAQEALERAETRMLDRSSMPSEASQPDMTPMVKQISQAREALGHRDWQQASQIVADMLKSPNMAANAGSGMGGAASMNGGAGMDKGMGMNGTHMNGSTGTMGSDMNSDMMNPPPGGMSSQPMSKPGMMAPGMMAPGTMAPGTMAPAGTQP